MNTNACINEIFSSPQGEGPHIGEKMTFVRFANCALGCQWCDTDYNPNKECSVYETDTKVSKIPNPVGIARLSEAVGVFDDETLAITGGEPLEQAGFLVEFLPSLNRKKKVLLETNGILHRELTQVVEYTDIISMDIKLPSSTGRTAFWDEHKKFLTAGLSSGKEIYVKLVVTSSTSDMDINEAIKLLSSTNRYIPVVIQPVTPTENFPEPVSEERLLSFKRLFGAWLPNVSILPQMHKVWGVR